MKITKKANTEETKVARPKFKMSASKPKKYKKCHFGRRCRNKINPVTMCCVSGRGFVARHTQKDIEFFTKPKSPLEANKGEEEKQDLGLPEIDFSTPR